jgi:hypothetical protein
MEELVKIMFRHNEGDVISLQMVETYTVRSHVQDRQTAHHAGAVEQRTIERPFVNRSM